MSMKPMTLWKSLVGAAFGVMAVLGLSACGDSAQKLGQATTYEKGKYQGKPDTRPYETGPTAYSQEKSWQAGDKVAWEKAIKTRQQAQNEYNRVE